MAESPETFHQPVPEGGSTLQVQQGTDYFRNGAIQGSRKRMTRSRDWSPGRPMIAFYNERVNHIRGVTQGTRYHARRIISLTSNTSRVA